jgi:hypothetical protein
MRDNRSVLRRRVQMEGHQGSAARQSVGPVLAAAAADDPRCEQGRVVREPRPTSPGPCSTQRQFAICYLLFVIPAEPKARPASRPLDAKCGDRGRSQDA